MQSTLSRATIVWFVIAGVSGVAAVFLHLYRSAFGAAAALVLAISAYAATALAVVSVYRGVMSAASGQDRARRNAEREREWLTGWPGGRACAPGTTDALRP